MHRRTAVVLFSLFFATGLFAKEVFLSVTGKANGFFTDARIFNPSYTKDITVNAQYLPAGNGDNTGATVVPLVIPKRTMKVYDDAVQSMFGGGPALGAIRLVSDDEFQASQRIYQDARESYQKGTLGQFVPGLDFSRGLKKGVIFQLKSGPSALGTFRTNWGGVNPNPTVANISFKLFDKNNALAGTTNLTMQPYGVFSPVNIVNFFGATADLSDAWMSFESDVPVFLYGSVVDNASIDPTFIAAVEDTGVAPPTPQGKTINVTAVNWDYTVTPSAPLAAGDSVRVIVRTTDGSQHGFALFTPGGQMLFDLNPIGTTPIERTITLQSGQYVYVCTRSSCGAGHTDMNGSFTVP